MLCHLQTLPPLRYLTADEEVTNERVRRHLDELYWFKPTRPPSRYLHLNCVLRTHAHAEFERSFPHALFTRHHLERALRGGAHPFGELLAPRLAIDRVTSPATIAEPLFGLDAPASEAEHSVLQYCIGNMLKCAHRQYSLLRNIAIYSSSSDSTIESTWLLCFAWHRSLLQEENLRQCLLSLHKEPVPYYSQLTDLRRVALEQPDVLPARLRPVAEAGAPTDAVAARLRSAAVELSSHSAARSQRAPSASEQHAESDRERDQAGRLSALSAMLGAAAVEPTATPAPSPVFSLHERRTTREAIQQSFRDDILALERESIRKCALGIRLDVPLDL